jgi:crotonobetainyl-CoA:carnitine CoA-transferase CaiB-like acyl-CoA transferase
MRDGRGRCIEVAQLEGFLPLVSEELIAYQLTGELPVRHGNERSESAFAAVLPTDGDDEWLAVECVTAEEAAALDLLTGGDPAAWATERAAADAAEELMRAGIAAAKVSREPDVLASEMLLDAGFWELIDREFVGTHLYPGVPIVADGERWQTGIPAPTLGQHSAEIRRTPWGREAAAVE